MVTETATAITKEQLHRLIEWLSEEQLKQFGAFVQSIDMHPAHRAALLAPVDDEPFTEEEEERVRLALADPRPKVPFEEMKEELGL